LNSGLVPSLLILIYTYGLYQARTISRVVNSTQLNEHSFSIELDDKAYALLKVKKVIANVLSLGVAYPKYKTEELQMLCEHLYVHFQGNLESLIENQTRLSLTAPKQESVWGGYIVAI